VVAKADAKPSTRLRRNVERDVHAPDNQANMVCVPSETGVFGGSNPFEI
jgi:hypothetical protein